MGISLSRKEKTTIRIRKLFKNSLEKANAKKAADHTRIKQVETLKDKSSKIMHIYNR